VRRLVAIAVALLACGPSPGQSCQDDGICGDELVCLKPAAAVNGICSFPFLGAGARCLSNAECAAGLFCSNDLSTGTRQFAGTCQPLQGPDAPCSRTADCQPPLECADAGDGRLGSCR
jgi:Dickkopf-like protein